MKKKIFKSLNKTSKNYVTSQKSMFLPILEHDPKGDQIKIKSHKLLLKAGLISQVKKLFF